MNLYVLPAMPNLVTPDFSDPWTVANIIILIISAVSVSLAVSRYAADRFGGDRRKTAAFFVGVTLCVCLLMLCFFGLAAVTIRGVILCLLLEYSTFSDIKTRECDDWVHVMIVIAAFIGRDLIDLPNMLIGAAFTGGIMLITAVAAREPVGGADIKLTGACAFMLGLRRGIIGLVIGTLLAVAVNLFKTKDKHEGFPMIPYLAMGFLGAYFI